LTGGTGSDVFVFGANWGSDRITDFTHKQDKIEIQSVTGVTSFGQLTLSQVGADTHVSAAGHEIVLAGVTATTINASDFLFVA
jgi:Ca2+-binding RTX toxin-like protein